MKQNRFSRILDIFRIASPFSIPFLLETNQRYSTLLLERFRHHPCLMREILNTERLFQFVKLLTAVFLQYFNTFHVAPLPSSLQFVKFTMPKYTADILKIIFSLIYSQLNSDKHYVNSQIYHFGIILMVALIL